MNGSEILDQLTEHQQELAAALADLDRDDAFPAGPEVSGLELSADDHDRARQVLTDLTALQERVAGLQTRIAGELAGMKRARMSPSKPAPRAVDTSL